jgi:hypothetical protein
VHDVGVVVCAVAVEGAPMMVGELTMWSTEMVAVMLRHCQLHLMSWHGTWHVAVVVAVAVAVVVVVVRYCCCLAIGAHHHRHYSSWVAWDRLNQDQPALQTACLTHGPPSFVAN